MSEPKPRRCTASTVKGRPCRAWAKRGTDPPRCAAHREQRGDPASPRPPVRASASPAEGEERSRHRFPDKSEATASLPPGAERRGPTGQAGERVNLDERIAGLNRRIERLGQLIDSLDGSENDVPLAAYTKLVDLYGQLCSRLGRLMRDRQQLLGSGGDELEQAIQEALDLASEMLKVEL